MLYLRGMWQFASLIFVFCIAVVLLLGDFFLFTTVFGMLIQTTFALRRARKADVVFVVSALSSSLPLLNEA